MLRLQPLLVINSIVSLFLICVFVYARERPKFPVKEGIEGTLPRYDLGGTGTLKVIRGPQDEAPRPMYYFIFNLNSPSVIMAGFEY
jgi:hypothetical protein